MCSRSDKEAYGSVLLSNEPGRPPPPRRTTSISLGLTESRHSVQTHCSMSLYKQQGRPELGKTSPRSTLQLTFGERKAALISLLQNLLCVSFEDVSGLFLEVAEPLSSSRGYFSPSKCLPGLAKRGLVVRNIPLWPSQTCEDNLARCPTSSLHLDS